MKRMNILIILFVMASVDGKVYGAASSLDDSSNAVKYATLGLAAVGAASTAYGAYKGKKALDERSVKNAAQQRSLNYRRPKEELLFKAIKDAHEETLKAIKKDFDKYMIESEKLYFLCQDLIAHYKQQKSELLKMNTVLSSSEDRSRQVLARKILELDKKLDIKIQHLESWIFHIDKEYAKFISEMNRLMPQLMLWVFNEAFGNRSEGIGTMATTTALTQLGTIYYQAKNVDLPAMNAEFADLNKEYHAETDSYARRAANWVLRKT